MTSAQSTSAASDDFQLATFEDRPFFEKALRHGVQHKIISPEKLAAIDIEAPKGIVQIATAFGSPYLRAELETARNRIVNLVSLYLSETTNHDLDKAARLIRDNTFLTLSRGGSGLLKELFALPEYPILGPYDHGRVEDFLEFWSRKKSFDDYRNTKRQRLLNQTEIKLAKKFGSSLSLPSSIYQEQHCEADALIRSALLLGLQKTTAKNPGLTECFNQIEFAKLLDSLRKKGVAKKLTISIALTEEELSLVQHLQHDMVEHDLPKIADTNLPLDQLINQLKNRYFIRDHEIDDSASYDALVSKEWSKYTKGKNDIDAILTLLLCIAAQVPGKVSLTESAAKTLIKKVRKEGFQPELATQFVQQHAPHEKQESLLEDWDDFCEQANLYLLDDWDNELRGALNFLHENCYVERSKK
ncbi:hypothetical protein [Sapientia aquatica]|uniref:Uncharacterized protein n=1 Tax=Sapientia aquatica TaxID=1549640 RepID=A0A4R5W0P1_9BURK|nr:hypothetical protein [Sapientia aquatica]TDK65349.1 hypothetical protein E2I14_13080 [Sapientia aquatica]